jgi:exonuclease SbcD
MKLCHISDVHLGYRAYHRSTPGGVNLREHDVYTAFEKALKSVLDISPDLVLITGDLFHVVRPSNRTIIQVFLLLSRFQERREGKPLIIIGGNHETPRSVDADCILRLFKYINGISVAYTGIEALDIEDARILCIPARGLGEIEKTEIAPSADAKVNILTVHGMLEGIGAQYGTAAISRAKILNSNWDYVAMGDYHIYQELAPNATYAGSTEFTTTNIWEEANSPKGFVEFDTEKKELKFHQIETRRVIDLEPIEAADMSADEINRHISENAAKVDITSAIVRQKVLDLSYSSRMNLDQKMIRQLRSEALFYYLDLRPPRRKAATATNVRGEGSARVTLEDEWMEFATSKFQTRPDRAELVEIGLNYLKKASEKEGA